MTKSILVIDDVFDDLQSIKNLLEKEGYKTTMATNGAQAMDLLKIKDFDLILVDIRMPTLSGYDLVRLIKEKANERTKLLYVSVVPQKEVLMDEVDGFVQKPFSEKTFLGKIKEVLEE